ncbi:ABC transporter substrate-binding protein [Thorsellia kenyensis]|uniref:ABC transporter substrate-binding protein n=1 Tax=Thorsellia kenyensis TaxID=1549888 RepID=A0ABV6CFD5_9GAMM
MKKNVKYTLSLLSASLSLCSLSVFAKSDSLTVWAWDPNFNIAIMQTAKEIYQAKNPDVEIKIEDFAKADVEQKMQAMLASGMSDTLPDIVLIEDYNAQKFLTSYPGAFEPMNGKVDYSQFAPYKIKMMTVDDKTYGLPFDTGVTGLYYRTDYIEQAGFKKEDLQNITWDRYIEIGKTVKEKTGKFMMGMEPAEAGLVRIMMHSAGSWYFDDNGELNLKNNTAFKRALELQKEMHKAGIVRPALGWSDWVSVFTSGDSTSIINAGVWITPTVESTKDQAGKWAVAPLPKLTGVDNATHYSNIGGSSWYVFSASPNKDKAIEFLNETFGKDVSFYDKILTERGAVGTFIPASQSEAYKKPIEFFGGQTIYQDFANWFGQIPSINYGLYTYEADEALKALMPAYFNDQMTLDQLIEELETSLQYQIQ